MYEKTVLENGLRVITSSMPHTRSVSMSIFVGAGSRYEAAEEAGISHFVEHLCFKGTRRRATAKEVSEAIEGVGGILNGATDRELTVYWCKAARPHFLLGMDTLLDMLHNSKFDPEEVEKERRVIIEELNMVMDSPYDLVETIIDQVIWPEQPLGQDVAGSKESVGAISRPSLLSYSERQYIAPNMVVSVAGDIDHDEVVETLQKTVIDWRHGESSPWHPAQNGQDGPRLKLETRNTEQAHLCLAVRGLSSLHPDRYALDLLNVILGEGMSSRLFLEIREKQGLAYDVHSYASHFLDAGALTVYAGVDPKHATATLEAILKELARFKEGVPEEELAKAKELTKGRMFLRMEDTRSVSSWMGSQAILTGEILTVDEVVSLLDRITTQDLVRVARELFVGDKLNLAVVGPFRSLGRFQRLLKL